MEKWQKEIEEILEHYQDEGSPDWLKMTEELIELTRKVDGPSGAIGLFVVQVLNIAVEKNQPLVAANIGFRIGVAYERYQNANRRV